MSNWKKIKLGEILNESKIESKNSSSEERIRVLLNANGVIKRPLMKETKGATKYFERKAGQFIYGKQNLHKGAFGIIPQELDGFSSTSDLPAFDVDASCLPEWIDYFLRQGDFYLSLIDIAKGAATKRIQPKALFEVEIPLPSIDIQKKAIIGFIKKEIAKKEVELEIQAQKQLLTNLKQSILQEAIQGKLTEGWRTSHPALVEGKHSAEHLLQSIKDEKLQLIADKKIKKQKPLPTITKEEIPFEIPKGWVWCRLGAIAVIKSGKRIHAADYRKDGIPFLRSGEIGSLGRGEPIKKPLFISKEKYQNVKSRFGIPKAGDILIACIGGSIGNTWVVDNREFYFKDGNLVLIESTIFFETNYLLSYLKSPFFWTNTILNATDSSYNALTIIKLNQGLFPLPPLEEQKEIVKKVEALMQKCAALIEEIKQSETNAQMLMQAVLKEAFEGVKMKNYA